VVSSSCLAEDHEPVSDIQQGPYWSIQLENDFLGSRDDRFYSHGMEVSYLRPSTPDDRLPELAQHMPFFKIGDVHAVQYTLGQNIFTPEDTETATLVKDDRPYAGWLYASVELLARIVEEPSYRVVNMFGITVGIVGPSSHADDMQKGIHDVIHTDQPQGWDNQLKDEPGVVLTYVRSWQYFHNIPDSMEFDFTPHVVGTLGNIYTYGGGGIMFRWGRGLRNDFAPPNIRPGFPGIPYFKPTTTPNWYLFAGFEAQAIARNIFLDGNSFKESHSVDKKPLVADFQFGFAFHIDSLRIALSNVLRSREFEGQPESTQFGAINISFLLSD